MPRFQITPFDVDAAGPEIWAAFHAHRHAIAAELHPDDPILSDAECEYEMRRTNPLWEVRRWVVLDGPDVAGVGSVWFRRAGTPNAEDHAPFLSCSGSVLAETRRKGVGTLLLREVHALMRTLDKTVLSLSAHTDAGHAFLTHFGAVAKLSTVESRAVLAELDWSRLRIWEDGVKDLGLVWERHAGRVPRDVLVSLLPTFTELISDVHLGSLDIAPIRYEIEGYDRWYETMSRTQGAHHLIVLREPSGAVAAMSEALWDSRIPEMVFQQLTATARPWRSRGLARAIKAAMLRQVRSTHPEAKEMKTGNAESNAAILSINRRVGFSVYRRSVDYQITRTELDAKISPLRKREASSSGDTGTTCTASRISLATATSARIIERSVRCAGQT
jgi:GNAT superfamily N-acetyltransferase